MTATLPPQIEDFIGQYHVVSLACADNANLWAANCFYAFDKAQAALILLTSSSTLHGNMMQKNPSVAGTISGQPSDIRDIEGIQFRGTAFQLSGEAYDNARRHYLQRHLIAKAFHSEIWLIRLDYIKHTQNQQTFAEKTEWHRPS